jgi:hypothetical protein
MKIVLVKFKTLSWPCQVLNTEGDIFEVMNLRDDSLLKVPSESVHTFDIQKLGETKNWRLRAAFAKAMNMMKR